MQIFFNSEVLDFRTSRHFRIKKKLEDSLLKYLNHLNSQSLTLGQEQATAIRNVVKNEKRPEVVKSRTSNCGLQEVLGTRMRTCVYKLHWENPPGNSCCVNILRNASQYHTGSFKNHILITAVIINNEMYLFCSNFNIHYHTLP